MSSNSELTDSVSSFAKSCRDNERLTAMVKNWNRTIHIEATDLGSANTLMIHAGLVTASAGALGAADMTIFADSDTLTRVFYGEISPNEPYNDGSLRIRGSEEDIVRLDFLIAMIWE